MTSVTAPNPRGKHHGPAETEADPSEQDENRSRTAQRQRERKNVGRCRGHVGPHARAHFETELNRSEVFSPEHFAGNQPRRLRQIHFDDLEFPENA